MSSPAENAATVRGGISEPHRANNRHEYKQALAALAALLAQAEAGALAEGREGMVTAYDHDGQYVGCIGRETWRWLIDHPEADAPALIRAREMFSERAFDQQKARAERAEADRDAAVRELREYEAEAIAARAERDVSDEASATWGTLLAEAQIARDAAVRAAERCPICQHEWRRHDPGDGKCDAPAAGAYGACPCGRDIAYHRVRNATLSKLALDDGQIARAALTREGTA